MSEMPVPSWAEEAKKQMFEAHGAIDYNRGGVQVRELNKILDFSTLFAEYFERDDTIVVHLHPRGGESDRYYPAEEKDGKRIPGRLELSIRSIQFPENIEELIKKASDAIWMGDVAVEAISVLRYEEDDDVAVDEPKETATGAYVVQFQGVKTTAHVIGPKKFVDTFCEELDKLLE
jgi:methionine-rich copper-binding protein CopC